MGIHSWAVSDFDQKIIDFLADQFKSDSGIDLRGDRMALQRLKEAAEKAKSCPAPPRPRSICPLLLQINPARNIWRSS